jgi:hypothetical protein
MGYYYSDVDRHGNSKSGLFEQSFSLRSGEYSFECEIDEKRCEPSR